MLASTIRLAIKVSTTVTVGRWRPATESVQHGQVEANDVVAGEVGRFG